MAHMGMDSHQTLCEVVSKFEHFAWNQVSLFDEA